MITYKSWHKYISIATGVNSHKFLDLCSNLDKAIASSKKLLKDDAASTVCVIEYQGQELVVKRSNIRGFFHGIKYALHRSRAKRNLINAQKLKSLGIKTFDIFAIVENRFGFLKGRSYLICSHLKGTDARTYYALDAVLDPQWQMVAKNIVSMINNLSKARVSHRDLNLSNIIIIDNQPWLIDLDGMRQYWLPFVAKWFHNKEKCRFLENWAEDPGAAHEALGFFEQLFDKS